MVAFLPNDPLTLEELREMVDKTRKPGQSWNEGLEETMKRLTEHHVNKTMGVYMVCSVACDDFNCTDCEKFNEIVDRLAAYEDTGLEPGEVVAMKIVLLGRELAKITDVDGVSINRICELAQAEKDGQLMILQPNDPLTLEELREMDGEPYWHVGLRDDSPPPHWAILPSNVAKCPQDYFYGKYWLAYRRKLETQEDRIGE